MPSSGMLCRVAVVRTDVSEDLSASIIRVTRIGELGTTLAIYCERYSQFADLVTLIMDVLFFRNVCSYKSHMA
jgi:hypothetical protein